MAKLRAYKLAEELELERAEFLRKAAAIGVELRSAMVGLDEAQVELLRRRLGRSTADSRDEKRIGGTIIRRRRKVVAPPPPQVEEPAAEVPAAPESEEVVAAAPEPAAASEAEPAVSEEPAVEAVPTRPEPRPPDPARELAPAVPAVTRRVPALPASEAHRGTPRRSVRREASQAASLQEQDRMARTLLGNVQHRIEQRRLVVDQQSRMQPSRRRRKTVPGRKVASPSAEPGKKLVKVASAITLPELSNQTGIKVRDVLRKVRALHPEFERGDRLELESVQLLAEELGFDVQRVRMGAEEQFVAAAELPGDDLEPRPPVVTVMGHVDHGKTSLLDSIRKTNVVDGESGGITQHIGAYQVDVAGGRVTFLDTPGHAAFTQMRARGTQVTDLVVLVVAADDGVMPQTVEAINHARAAGVPLVVAVNKIDRPDANPGRVKQRLLESEVVLEEFGGDTIGVEVSAVKGTNIEKLLELLHLQAEVLELKAQKKGPARGTVLEARLDRGRGAVATILVREGTLKKGDAFVVGKAYGRVRTMTDDQGNAVKEATPSTPVEVVGLSDTPEAGDEFAVVKNEREARAVAEDRIAEERRALTVEPSAPSAEDLFASLSGDEERHLRLVVKADVRGTLEAIRDSVVELSTDRVQAEVLHTAVGAISESDVMLASASSAIVVGFHVRPEPAARKAAERHGVEIRTFDVVYELLDDMVALMSGLLPPKIIESVTGHAEVRQLFTIPRLGTIAGCFVPEGAIRRGNRIRVLRDGVPIYAGPLRSLRRFKDDVREVLAGLECGIGVENFNDVKVGDILESYSVEERPDEL